MFMPDCNCPTRHHCRGPTAVTKKAEEIIQKTPGVKYCTSIVGYSMLSRLQTHTAPSSSSRWRTGQKGKNRRKNMRPSRRNLKKELGEFRRPSPFPSRRRPFPASGLREASPSSLRIGQERTLRSLPNRQTNFLRRPARGPNWPASARPSARRCPRYLSMWIAIRSSNKGWPFRTFTRPSSASWAASFVNYFNRFGRQWQIYVQAEGEYRTNAKNLGQFHVRNNDGVMVPLSAVTACVPRPGRSLPCVTTFTAAPRSTDRRRRDTVRSRPCKRSSRSLPRRCRRRWAMITSV